MKIENGKIIYEVVNCISCDGTGRKPERRACPNYGQKQNGKPCQYCGSRSKNNHRHLETGQQINCRNCNGTGKTQENKYSFMPSELWPLIPKTVKRIDRSRTFNECYIGIGQICGATDYGRAWDMDSAEFLDKLNKEDSHFHQPLKFTDDKNNIIPLTVLIMPTGYTVIANTIEKRQEAEKQALNLPPTYWSILNNEAI